MNARTTRNAQRATRNAQRATRNAQRATYPPPVNASDVAAQLHLGPRYAEWLEALDALGAPTGGVPLPTGQAAARLLRRLEVDEADLEDILAHLPEPSAQPALWWLVERAYHGVVRDLGDLEANRPTPQLPAQLGTPGRLFWVYVFLAAVDHIRRWHQQRGVSDTISWATLADLGRHIRLYRLRTGCIGFDTPWWLSLHFRGTLFALGRLQFNPYRLQTASAGPLLWYDPATANSMGDGFRAGDQVLGVHIPESGRLTPELVEDSLTQAKRFFTEVLPEHACRVATCTSWLLDDQLLEYLDPRSNIVRFQRRFELVPGAREADSSPIHFVFHRRLDVLDDIQPRTTLENALVRHLKAGRHWHVRTGWLRL
jgi:hypothetical protein